MNLGSITRLANKLSIIEKVNENKTSDKGKKFYLPHRPVIRESAEAAKIRIVSDASAKPNKDFCL